MIDSFLRKLFFKSKSMNNQLELEKSGEKLCENFQSNAMQYYHGKVI